MRTVFAIAPWEYPGADFDPNAGAFTRHVFAGKERELWLKMRAGVIYFGEIEHPRVYAVTRLFDDAIAFDAEQLIAVWRSEVERENYGAYLVIRHRFPRALAIGSYCLVVNTSGSGWIKEHFEDEWQKFANLLPEPLRLWGMKPLGAKGAFVVQQLHHRFLERAVSSAHFQTVEAHWTHGTADEMTGVVRSAAQLWHLPFISAHNATQTTKWLCESNSIFFNEKSYFYYRPYPRYYNATFGWIQELVRWHYAFIGVEWKKATQDKQLQEEMSYKQRKMWQRSIAKWGENWRGNFVGKQYQLELFMPPVSTSSMHDKLEAARVMKEFLSDKAPAEEVEQLIQEAFVS